MATYVNDLRLKEIATGDESGTWGTSTNTNLELIAEAFSYGTEAITTNADTHTTTIADGSTDPGRSIYLKYTGTLDSACTITIGPNTVSKLWFIENATSGSQNIIISQGSGANITIPAGDTKVVYSDGAGSGAAFFDAFANLKVTDPAQTNITSVGTLTTLTVDDITINGSTISDGGDLTLDVGGDIILDADGGDIKIKDGGTDVGIISVVSTDRMVFATADGLGLQFDKDNNRIVPCDAAGDYNNNVELGDSTLEFTNLWLSGAVNAGEIDITEGSDARMISSNSISEVGSGNFALQVMNSAGSALKPFGIRAEDIRFATGASERMRIDSSGNVGIGVVPSAWSSSSTALQIGSLAIEDLVISGANVSVFYNNAFRNSSDNIVYIESDFASAYTQYNGEHIFNVAPSGTAGATLSFTNAMRITNSGNVGIGTTSPSAPLDVVTNSTVYAAKFTQSNTSNGDGVLVIVGSTAAADYALSVRSDEGNTSVLAAKADGKVGIGTFSPASLLSLQGDAEVLRLDGTANTTRTIFFRNTTSSNPAQIHSDGSLKLRAEDSGTHIEFHTADTERMRIDSSGNLLVGTTTGNGANAEGFNFYNQGSGDSRLYIGHVNGTANGTQYVNFLYNSGIIGSISQNGVSAVLYNTSSDARLKDVTGKARGLEVINELNPVAYNWKADGKADEGLIAQEVKELVPNAVSGSEEEMYQMDYSKLVVHLVAGMKEQQTIIESLEARITALES
jgi:hypothetical protein